MRNRSGLAGLCLTSLFLLSGCSALVLATGTDEEDLVGRGSTAAQLESRLGAAIHSEVLDPPASAMALASKYTNLRVLAKPEWFTNSSGKPEMRQVDDVAVRLIVHKFSGRLKRKHDVGESVSLNLMTFGVFEVFMLPAAIGQRASAEDQLLIAWLSKDEKVVAYQWTKP